MKTTIVYQVTCKVKDAFSSSYRIFCRSFAGSAELEETMQNMMRAAIRDCVGVDEEHVKFELKVTY